MKNISIGINFTIPIPANTEVSLIRILPTQSTPTLRIGTTLNGTDIMNDTLINEFIKVKSDAFFIPGGMLFFTFSGEMGLKGKLFGKNKPVDIGGNNGNT